MRALSIFIALALIRAEALASNAQAAASTGSSYSAMPAAAGASSAGGASAGGGAAAAPAGPMFASSSSAVKNPQEYAKGIGVNSVASGSTANMFNTKHWEDTGLSEMMNSLALIAKAKTKRDPGLPMLQQTTEAKASSSDSGHNKGEAPRSTASGDSTGQHAGGARGRLFASLQSEQKKFVTYDAKAKVGRSVGIPVLLKAPASTSSRPPDEPGGQVTMSGGHQSR